MVKGTTETWQKKECPSQSTAGYRGEVSDGSFQGRVALGQPKTDIAIRQGQTVLGSGTDRIDLFRASPRCLLMQLVPRASS